MKFELFITRLKVFALVDHFLSFGLSTKDNIMVYGFWRSGTTFIMEQVAAITSSRSYFEPLLLKIPGNWPVKYARRHSPELHKFIIPDELNRHPYLYIGTNQSESGIDTFINQMMVGKVSSKWTRKSRPLKYAFKKNISLKLVRANLMAAYLSKRYSCKSVFVLRHPCGIIASMTRKHKKRKNKGSIETGLNSAAFIDSILYQESLVRDYLSPFLNAINKWKTNEFNRIILVWAITNYVPLKQIKDGKFKPFFILYEALVLDSKCYSQLAEYLNNQPIGQGVGNYLDRDSATVQGERGSVPPMKRLFSWRDELSPTQVQTVYEICASFGSVIMDQIEAIDHFADEMPSEAMTK